MNWILSCALLLVSFCAAFLLFELRNARAGYLKVYDLLVRDRDAAREEIVLLRKALFPQLDRVVARPSSSSSARPEGDGPTTVKQPKSAVAPTLLPNTTREPFRKLFKRLVAQHNTGQRHLDKIAEGIAPQEKKA